MLNVLFANELAEPNSFLEKHSSEFTILLLTALVVAALLALVPQLLKSRRHSLDLLHAEHMKALEQGQHLPNIDERSLAAGRTATLVPMVVVCAAATVTCFLVAYRSENTFAMTLAAWTVAGVVSLAAITGGVALMGRLAQLHLGVEDEEAPEDEAEE